MINKAAKSQKGHEAKLMAMMMMMIISNIKRSFCLCSGNSPISYEAVHRRIRLKCRYV
jgi:hypothetical protein